MSDYDPTTFEGLRFHDATAAFRAGDDTPGDYLERCIEQIDAREPVVQAFAALNVDGARESAALSTERWRRGKPLSRIDGMPIGIKDLLETKDMATEHGCNAYAGNFPKRDNPAVWALREAGAVIVGKTVTAELGGIEPGPTTNPFDPARTPGGSSSGSAAAVASGMLPAAIGTQVGGSIIRPAGFCGNVALKPSQGGINRGERQATSMSTHGVHANCVEDMWHVAIEIARRVGGDPGYPGLRGPADPPEPVRPRRVAVLETEGWGQAHAPSLDAFARLLDQLRDADVALLTRADHPSIETLEQAIREARRIGGYITLWENRWAQRNLINEHPDGVSERTQRSVRLAEAMSPDDYRSLLQERAVAQAAHRAISDIADAAITLSCLGPAPVWAGDEPGKRPALTPTGDPVFNLPSSLLFAPAVSMPLLGVNGLPVGVQFFGQPQDEAKIVGFANWAMSNLKPVVA